MDDPMFTPPASLRAHRSSDYVLPSVHQEEEIISSDPSNQVVRVVQDFT